MKGACNKPEYVKRRYPRQLERVWARGGAVFTVAQYDRLLEKQHGLCAVCRRPEKRRGRKSGVPQRLSVDHCHTTGKIRGLLCGNCNTALGLLGENVAAIENLARYLASHTFPDLVS